MIRKLVLAATLGVATMVAPAMAMIDQPHSVGHNGNWEIIAGANSREGCIMIAKTADYRQGLMIGVIPGEAINAKQDHVMLGVHTDKSNLNPEALIAATDPTGALLLNKWGKFLGAAGGSSWATELTAVDLLNLWGKTVLVGDSYKVHIAVAGNAFDIDIGGLNDAYQNAKSCAVGVRGLMEERGLQ